MNTKIKSAIILAGGRGTRLSEQTKTIPKPLVPIGDTPIIIHIMKHLINNGIEKIIIAGGYKVELIKNTILEQLCNFDEDVILDKKQISGLENAPLLNNCQIIITDTGEDTGTAQRLKMAADQYLDENEPFLFTYGDTVSNVKLKNVIDDLFSHENRIMSLTAVQFNERFGILRLNKDTNEVTVFSEKSMSEDEFINGGFIACKHEVLDYIKPTDNDFSKEVMPKIQKDKLLGAYIHKGFWYAMDTQRDYEHLNKLYKENEDLFK